MIGRLHKCVLLSLMVGALSACAATPPLESDCEGMYVAEENREKKITKCKKRVMSREQSAFERSQEEAQRDACAASGRVWMRVGYNSGCVARGDVQAIFGGGRYGQQY